MCETLSPRFFCVLCVLFKNVPQKIRYNLITERDCLMLGINFKTRLGCGRCGSVG